MVAKTALAAWPTDYHTGRTKTWLCSDVDPEEKPREPAIKDETYTESASPSI